MVAPSRIDGVVDALSDCHGPEMFISETGRTTGRSETCPRTQRMAFSTGEKCD